MFIHHNDLIDDTKLPPASYFIEPRDLHKIQVEQNDTYNTFSQKVVNYRTSKNYPQLTPNELRLLVIASLESNTPKAEISKYFQLTAILPSLSQLASFAKSITQQISQKAVGYNQRQTRASKCLSCAIHRQNNTISSESTIKKVISTISDKSLDTLQDLQLGPEEQKVGTCGMCGCGLKAKVQMSTLGVLAGLTPAHLDVLLKVYGPEAFSRCWILEEATKDYHIKGVLEGKLRNSAMGGLKALETHISKKIHDSQK